MKRTGSTHVVVVVCTGVAELFLPLADFKSKLILKRLCENFQESGFYFES